MSTAQQIIRVYREDQRRPYYSLQGGTRPRRLSRAEQRKRWIWGHFQEALRRALTFEAGHRALGT